MFEHFTDRTRKVTPLDNKDPTEAIRILDAAANRATEGLRVVEDYVRFVLDDAYLTELAKQLRHDLAAACTTLRRADRAAMRDTQCDVGTEISTHSEAQRLDTWEVCQASFERTKQSLRSLEEFGKIIEPRFAGQIEALRYRSYTLEKAVVVSIESGQRLRDVSLCVLVDGQDSPGEFAILVSELFAAGVGMIQLRDKRLADGPLLGRAERLVEQARRAGSTCIIINDRPDIAAAADADGVHLGQDDLSVKDARAILGPRKLIGVSTHAVEQARAAVLDGANYLGAGPTFPSTTKTFSQFPGLEYLEQVAAEISLPLLAIGGIDATNLPQVLQTGVTRVAVSAAVGGTENPGSAAQSILKILRDSAALGTGTA